MGRMENIISVDALVVRISPCGESDKMLTLLSGEYGKISALAKGSRKLTSKLATCSVMFAYANFTLGKSKDIYFVREAQPHNVFLSGNRSVEKFALASYVVQVAQDVATSEEQSRLLSLTLNTLYMIGEDKKPLRLVKAVFEMRAACLCGFLPDVSKCRICGVEKPELSYAEVMNGTLICSECKKTANTKYDDGCASEIISLLDTSSLHALRHIIYSDGKRIFAFNIQGGSAELLYNMCEKYLLNQLERSFTSLEFYKQIMNAEH